MVETGKYDVVAVGTLNVDLVMIGDAPREMDALLEWVDASEVELMAAGSVGYTAVDMARLGLRVSMLSSVADDPLGRLILEALEREGVETGAVTVEPGARSGIGVYMLLFGSRKRPLTGRMAGHAPWPTELSDAAMTRLESARLLHCGGYLHYPQMWGEPAERLYRRAKELGLVTSMDPQFPFKPVEGSWLPLFGDLLQYVDMLMTDESEAERITGLADSEAAARRLVELGPKLVAVKLGAKGSILCEGGRVIRQEAFPVDKVVDSIGAGDAFDAGLIHSRLNGHDLVESARFAAATAALTLKGMGGTQTAPTVDEVRRLLDGK